MRRTVRWFAAALVLGLAWALPSASPVPAVVGAAIAFGGASDGSLPDVLAAFGARPAPAAPVQPAPAGMAADEQSAVAVVDGFWKRHFTEIFGRPYRSPRVIGAYLGKNGPTCGRAPSVPFNAFYCRPGDYLAWDDNLMAAGYKQIGDSWVYLVIAHEWGHAIQARARRGLSERSIELQADCLAGATLQGAARDGLVKVEPGDADELSRTLAAAADDYPWTNQKDHGDAQQRTAAFNTGAQNGVKACF